MSCLLTYSSAFSFNNIKITNSEYSETDPEIIVNPYNSSNLISSSLQHKYSYGKDNFLNAISYSFDKGLTWSRYKDEILPDEDYKILISASDNKLFFSSDGVANAVWINTLVKPGNISNDSIVQLINFQSSEDGGVTWHRKRIRYGRTTSFYDATKEFFGLQERISDLKLFEYDSTVYLSYALKNTNNSVSDRLVLMKRDDPESKTIINIPDSLNFNGGVDLKIKDKFAYVVFFSTNWFNLSLYYLKYDLQKNEIINLQSLTKINFIGTSLLPNTMPYNIKGLASNKINPNPLINFIGEECIITWCGSEYNKQNPSLVKKNNIYLAKMVGDVYSKGIQILPDTVNHQMVYDLKINEKNAIVINFLNLKGPDLKYDYATSSDFMLSTDMGVSFTKPFQYSNVFNIFASTKRNFNYGIGYKNTISINDDYIYLTWVDASIGNGNTEIMFNSFPIDYNYQNYNAKLKSLSVTKIYPNPCTELIKLNIFSNKIQNIQIDLFDINGKLMSNLYNDVILFGDNHLELNLDNFVAGEYYLICKSKDETIFKKVIKLQ